MRPDDGFIYIDDAFRGTSQPGYASGVRLASGGLTGGGLSVTLGGLDGADILNMSGGWERTFSLGSSTENVVLTFNLQLDPGFGLRERRAQPGSGQRGRRPVWSGRERLRRSNRR